MTNGYEDIAYCLVGYFIFSHSVHIPTFHDLCRHAIVIIVYYALMASHTSNQIAAVAALHLTVPSIHPSRTDDNDAPTE